MAQGTTVDVRTLTIDVRTIFPRDRHPVIFSTFERLKPGEGFELVSEERHHSFGKDLVGQYWALRLAGLKPAGRRAPASAATR